MKKGIAILSGGLDSAVSTTIAAGLMKVVMALTFDYGQRAIVREIASAKKIAKRLRIPHRIIKLPFLKELTKNPLTQKGRSLSVKTFSKKSAESVWVPNRNALFINIAASFAETMKANFIITGFNREEAVTFPDNSEEFIKLANKTLQRSTLSKPKVVSFVAGLNKKQIFKKAVELDIDIAKLWWCYDGLRKPCGVCESCRRIENGIQALRQEYKL